ncbi:HDIG domain-containing protein [bacterium]|nr:HDIG domain-containing protein [bacterium]
MKRGLIDRLNFFKRRQYPILPWVLWLILSASTMFLFPYESGYQFSSHSLDSISREEVIAPFSFEVEYSSEELAKMRNEALANVEPIFQFREDVPENQRLLLGEVLSRIEETGEEIRSIVISRATLPTDSLQFLVDSLAIDLTERLRGEFGINLSRESWHYLADLYVADFNFSPTWRMLPPMLTDILGRGVLDRSKETVEAEKSRIRIISRGEEQIKPLDRVYDSKGAQEQLVERLHEFAAGIEVGIQDTLFQENAHSRLGYELVDPLLVSSLEFDEVETNSREQKAIAKVPLVKTIVLKGERIIDSNERITKQHIEKLQALERKRREMITEENIFSKPLRWAGRFLLAGLIYFFFGYWLYKFRRKVFYKPNALLLLTFLLGLLVAFFGTVIQPLGVSSYLFPSALGAIIVTIVFDAPLAFVFTISLAFMTGAIHGVGFFSVLEVFFPAMLAVFPVQRVRTRVQIMRSSIFIFLGFLLVILIQKLMVFQFGSMIWNELFYVLINSLGTPLLALGMLIAIEWVFGVTTNLTLLELADLNRPLLKRLSLEAPGTYHHSIMVGNLAEAGAEAIGANSLLVRAGAYYHDIGKMVSREYFVENQKGIENIHDSLDPEESAKHLSAHVTEGVRIANEYHLPSSVKAFIREHHGTGLMVFFYNKAMKEKPEGSVDEATYRYPGPKPQSKETGILMLADSAEAASRSLDNPKEDTIRNTVRDIVINKYRDMELDECPLTLRDIRLIIEAFLPILEGIHHHRIKYPSRKEVEDRRDHKTA